MLGFGALSSQAVASIASFTEVITLSLSATLANSTSVSIMGAPDLFLTLTITLDPVTLLSQSESAVWFDEDSLTGASWTPEVAT